MIRHEHQLDSSALKGSHPYLQVPVFSFATFSIYCFVWTYTVLFEFGGSRLLLRQRLLGACSRAWYSRSRSLEEVPPIWTTTSKASYDHRDPDPAPSSYPDCFLDLLLFRLFRFSPHDSLASFLILPSILINRSIPFPVHERSHS